MRILLIEDSPGDAALAREYLSVAKLEHTLEHCETLEEGLADLQSNPPDVLVLDLGLPDCEPHETHGRARATAPDVPIVVLSDNEPQGLECVAQGAQDFIPKSEVSPGILARAVLFAAERRRLQRRLESNPDEVRARLNHFGVLDRAIRGLSSRSRSPEAPPLEESSPQVFTSLQERYAQLAGAIVQRASDELPIVEACYAVSDQLAYLGAQPSDLIDLHQKAVHQVVPGLSRQDQLVLARAAPELLVQMLGHLAEAYRHHSLSERRETSPN